MPIVSLRFSFTRDRERLTRRGTSPEFAAIGPSGETGCKRPSSNSGEEVALRVSGKVSGSNIENAPCVYVAGGNQPIGD